MMRAILATLAILASASPQADAARPVALSDASTLPSWAVTLRPGASAPVPYLCAHVYTDASAYRANGAPLAAQQRSANGRHYWRVPGSLRRARVTFDGRRFRNRTTLRTVVAVWGCDVGR